MKTLYLVRHAKSSWEDFSVQDYERTLLPKGINRTMQVAKHLHSKLIHPELIISSHAVRAFETARILAKKLNYPIDKIKTDPFLYFAGSDAIYHVIFGLPEKINEVMLVGHNPDMTQFVNKFLKQKIDYLPTTGVVSISFHCKSWKQIMEMPYDVNFVLSPKTI